MRPFLLAMLLGAAACRGSDTPGSGSAALRPADVPRSDSALTAYLAWQRELMHLVNRQRVEQDRTAQRITAASSQLGAAPIAHDSAFLALVARQRREAQELSARMPQGPTVTALGTTLAGLGQMTADERGYMVFIPRRDEAALARAREKYGSAFVDWMVARESRIAAALGPEQ